MKNEELIQRDSHFYLWMRIVLIMWIWRKSTNNTKSYLKRIQMHVWPWSCQKPSMIKNILLHMMPVIRFSARISNWFLIGRKRHVFDINLKCLISFRPSSESNLPCELELSIFKPKLRSRVHLRSNLIDTGIAICSPSVPTTFSDASNLDLATINGFVKRMLDDAAISGEEVFLYRHLYILYRLYYIIINF